MPERSSEAYAETRPITLTPKERAAIRRAARIARKVPRLEARAPEPEKPDFNTVVAAAKGDSQARRKIRIYAAHARAKGQADAQTQALIDAQFGTAVPNAARANKVASPYLTETAKALAPTTAIAEAYHDARRGNLLAAGLSAASIFPVGRGPRLATGIVRAAKAERAAERAERVAKAGLKGRRAVVQGERVQQIPGRSASRLTRTLIEKPADIVSERFPNAPLVGSRARVAKHAGREQKEEIRRARVKFAHEVKALPKRGSDEDVAHFWWAQLPPSLRNQKGLVAVRDRLTAELKTVTETPVKGKMRKGKPTEKFLLAKADQPQKAKDIAAAIARLDQTIKANPKLDKRTLEAVRAMSGERRRILEEVGLLNPENAGEREQLVTKWLTGAKFEKGKGIVGGEGGGGEIFLGHRVDRAPGMQRIRSMGTGKPKAPPGVSQNKMALLSSGRLRMSTHVAAEDLASSQTYQDALRARNTLSQMGEKLPHVEGEIPDKPIPGYMIVNPHGSPVPRNWKTDRLAQLSEGGGEDAIREAARDVLKGFIGDASNWSDIVNEAKATGVADDLRIVPEKTVQRFYAQFLPVPRGSVGGRAYDKLIDATAASLIFARIGYIPKNVAQNLVMAVPHQGPRLLVNAARSGQLLPRPGQSEMDRQLWRLLTSEVSAGPSGAVAQEATSRALGAPANAVTTVADAPLRVSALLNEFANQGVIPKWSARLSDKDKQALLDALTNPEKRPLLNDAMQRARDGMADFDRLNPTQRRWARRFLIVPGWLAAGTRYPFRFAANYPGRTAALAYVAAGEPGAPDEMQVNRPVNEYLAGGLPSFLKGVGVGGDSVFRTQSLFPASLPADIAFAVGEGDPLTAFSYANPLPESIALIARSQRQKLNGETENVPFMESVVDNAKRLAPNVGLVQDLISPPSGEDRLYPDTSRLGRLKRETGVLPVEVNKDVALRMRFSERGMDQSIQTIDRKRDLLKKIEEAGEKPSKLLLDTFDLQLERSKRLDKISAHGLTYQQKAYKSDIGLLVQKGILTRQEGAATLRAASGADEDTIKKWRRWLTDHKFGNDVVQGVRDYLRDQSK